tara:strand:+ start:495 stop:737 length:243 start_codon:yes stop_codon:yes gene_type:complete
MENKEKYYKIFEQSLSISKDKINDNLEYNEVPEWDSIGHMTLIADLEEAFQITFETDDIIDFSSFSKGKKILKEKYKIEI